MKNHYLSLLLFILLIKVPEAFSYNVSVVEYMYEYKQALNPQENLQRNVDAHVKLIHLLKGKSELVVFPEGSLSPAGGSSAIYSSVPEPSYSVPNLKDKPLKAIAEAAKHANIWVVLNIPERAGRFRYSTSLVFRRNGTIAARYRKSNVGVEDVDIPAKPEVSYFDTDFGVRFGLFASMDLAFQSPAMDLVKLGIKHFVYPTAWPSSLPYLVGNQAQQSWSWTHDVTLLAAGLNRVSKSQTGSGIFRGRSDHLTKAPNKYYMARIPTSLVITGQLYKNSYRPSHMRDHNNRNNNDFYNMRRNFARTQSITTAFSKFLNESIESVSQLSQLKLDSSSFKNYTTKLLTPDKNCDHHMSETEEFYRCNVLEKICQGNLCCHFDVTVDFFICPNPCLADNLIPQLVMDDSFLFFRYRLAVMDGVDSPWKVGDTLGMQVCSIVPCLTTEVSTCGQKPNPNSYRTYTYNRGRIWSQSVSKVNITGVFRSGSSTLLMPSLLLGEVNPTMIEFNKFGMLSNNFYFSVDKSKSELLLPEEGRNLGSVGIINRIFSRDGFIARASEGRARFSHIIGICSAVIFIIQQSLFI